MRNLLSLLLAFGVGSSVPSPDTAVADRVVKQKALFEEYYQAILKSAPRAATSVGEYRYNAQLEDVSLAEIARQHAEDDAFLARLRAIPTAGMAESDRLSHELLERQLTRADVNYELKNHEMLINQQNGIQTALADLPLGVPLDSVRHYEDYVERLHQIPRALRQTIEVLRAGERDGLMPPRIVVDQLPGQCEGIIASDPFLLPLKKLPASFTEADKQRLADAVTRAATEEVLPAYKAFAAFLRDEYAPKGRAAISVESLPDGKRRYREAVRTMTTVDITPEAVHELGLRDRKST